MAKFRFDFELADPNHLESILWAIKRVDSVYAAYRVLPGHAHARVAEPCSESGTAERIRPSIQAEA